MAVKSHKPGKLTKKQRGFVQDYLKTGNGVKSVLNNYDVASYHTASVIASENLEKPAIRQALEEALPDSLLDRVHREGLEANKIISANITYGDADEKTNDFVEVPDHLTRAKFLDMAYKRKGRYAPEKQVNVVVDVKPTERVSELIARLTQRGGADAAH